QFGSYADSYQTGALVLIGSALSKIELRDYIVYPAIFLIRHYLELRLKELIQGLNYCQKQSRDFTKGHNIEFLWATFKTAYASIEDNPNDEKLKVVDRLIKEMVRADPTSAAFRYPLDQNGANTQKLEYVNLRNLRETFVRVSFFFDGVALQVAHYAEMTEVMVHDIYENYR